MGRHNIGRNGSFVGCGSEKIANAASVGATRKTEQSTPEVGRIGVCVTDEVQAKQQPFLAAKPRGT